MTLRVLVYALIASIAAAPLAAGAQTPTYQGALAAKIAGPRRVASSADGAIFVVDVAGGLHRLTPRGDRVAKLLDGVASVAAGPGVLLAGMKDGSLLRVDPRTGRIVRRLAVASSEAPAALALDAKRGKVWMAYESGMLQARALDGARLHHVPPSSGVYRLSGVAVDPAGTVWVAQERTGVGSTLHAFNADTGALVRSAPVDGVGIVGGIAADSGGRIYVTDYSAGTVQILGADGARSGSVGSRGTKDGQLSEPASAALMSNGDLLVANMDAGRLDRFGSGAPLPTCAGDTDCDGLSDEWELANGLDKDSASDALSDRDGDGLNATEELAVGSSARSADTDGDGFKDGDEVAAGFDPTDPNDHRPRVAASGPERTDPGLVRLSATVRDPAEGGGACSVEWRQTAGAPVMLSNALASPVTFVARTAGSYAFEARGACGGVAAIPATVQVAVNNVAPRADGGRVVTLAAGGRLRLSSLFSSDANADALAFQWDQIVGPPLVAGVGGEALEADVPEPGYYVFRLGAVDGSGTEGAAEVPVVVLGDAAVPTALAASPIRSRAGEVVTLDASASYGAATAKFWWQQVDGPPVAIDDAGAPRAAFVAPTPGRYAFEVSVEEAGLRGPPARVEVYAAATGGALPVAKASAPAAAAIDVPVTLDGTASVGSGALTYAWRQTSGPAAGLTRADRAAATVVLFEAGSYEFELVVADAAGPGVPVRVRVDGRARNAPNPVAVAAAPGTAAVGEVVVLDGSASIGAMRYRWTQVEGPWVAIEQGAVGAVRPPLPGVYGFELEVDDGAVRSAPARVNVVVFQNRTEN